MLVLKQILSFIAPLKYTKRQHNYTLKQKILKSKSASTHKSMGIRISADRIALPQQEKQMESSIVITDLVLDDDTPGGTEVIIKIPLSYA